MSNVIPEKYVDLFQKKAFASLGTLMPDGRPQVTPVWVDFDGEHVIFNSAKGRQKDRNVRREVDPDGGDLRAAVGHQGAQAGEEISRRRQISLRSARRSPRHLQNQARTHHSNGI